MAEETIITWTPANWITVVLMVVTFFVVAGAAYKIWQQKMAA